jgi:hypothetical protein
MMTATWNGRMKARGRGVAVALALAAVMLWSGGGRATIAFAQAPFETPPLLPASELAPPDLLQGPTFTVDPQVPIQGMLGQFTIRSDVGTFEAHGRELLRIRVGELHGLAQIERMSKSEEFLRAAGRAVARPVESTANMLLHPVETVQGVPGGVARFFDRVEMLAAHHRTVEPLAAVTAQGTVIGRTQGGALLVPGAVDYVAWTERVAGFTGRTDLQGAPVSVWVTGRLSPEAQREFAALGWTVYQNLLPPWQR